MGAAIVWIACLVALLTQAQRSPTEEVILLPNHDGKPTAVNVATPTAQVVLDQPYRTATVEKSGKLTVADGDPDAIKARYAELLKALPQPAAVFVLYFDTNAEQLVPESAARLADIKAQLSERPAPEIIVIGHTDTVDTLAFNDALSLRRATAVKAMLVEAGVDAERIVVQGRGERELLIPTAQDVDEPRNRRVEIRVR